MTPGTAMDEDSDDSNETAWYERWFDTEAYELVYRDRDESDAAPLIDLVEELASPRPGARILDVACGRGRHARLLARRGYRVTGIDLSGRALDVARRRAAEENLDVEFRQGDMRDPIGTSEYDGAVNLFTSFGYFETDEEHRRALERIADALVPGGWFVQDFLNPPHVHAHLVRRDARVENGVRIEQRRWITGERLNKEIELTRQEDPKRAETTKEPESGMDGAPDSHTFHESVRLLTLEDFRRLYREAGLVLCETRGSYGGEPYDADRSPRLILHARKDR